MGTAPQNMPLPSELIAAATADPEVREAAKRIVMALLQHVDYTIQWGTTHEISVLAKSVVPAILKSMQTAERTQEERQAAEAYADIRAAIGAIVSPEVVLQTADVETR